MTPTSLLLLASLTRPAGAEVLRHALLVGSNAPSEELVPLLYAEDDARRMANLLIELGGFQATDITVLHSPSGAQLDAAIALHHDLAATHDEDLFLFYYSGHADNEGLRLGGDRKSFDTLRSEVRAVPAEVRLGVLDACRSGEITRLKGLALAQPFIGEDDLTAEGEAWLTASSADESAQESDRLRGSFFTHYLLSGLRGAADTGDGVVSLDEAYVYAYDRTVARTGSTTGGTQHPSYDYRIQGNGNLALTDVKRASARLRLPEDLAGVITVLRLPDELPVAEIAKPAGSESVLALPAGSYRLQIRSAGALQEATFGLGEGSEHLVRPGAFRLQDGAVAMKGSGEEADPAGAGAAPEGWRAVDGPPRPLRILGDTSDQVGRAIATGVDELFRKRPAPAPDGSAAGSAEEPTADSSGTAEQPLALPVGTDAPVDEADGSQAEPGDDAQGGAESDGGAGGDGSGGDDSGGDDSGGDGSGGDGDGVAMADEGGAAPQTRLPPELAPGLAVERSGVDSTAKLDRVDLRRSPAIGALASAVIPGAGQFYNGEWVKGSLFLGGWATATSGAFGVRSALGDEVGDWGGMLWTGPTPLTMTAQIVRGWSAADAWQFHKQETVRPVTGVTLSYSTLWATGKDNPATVASIDGANVASTGLIVDWVLDPGFSLGLDRTGYLRRPDGTVVVDTGTRMMFGFFERSRLRPGLFLFGGLEIDTGSTALVPVHGLLGGGGNLRWYLTPRYFVELEGRVGSRGGDVTQGIGAGLGVHFAKPGQGRPESRAERRARESLEEAEALPGDGEQGDEG